MTAVQKKIVIDDSGSPTEVIIPWKQYCEIAEAFGWDLEPEEVEDLLAVKRDIAAGNTKAFIPLSKL